MESIPTPPAVLATPNLTVLEAGALLHRVHDRRLAPNAFNPCHGGPTRFAPIRDSDGRCVPSLYAGRTLVSAIFETVFHDVPAEAEFNTVPRYQIDRRSHGTLQLRRAIRLANLRAADLKKWNVTRAALIASPPSCYSRTAEWARAIHDQFPDVEGLIWTSNQCDPDDVLLLFGDRVAEPDLGIVAVRDGGSDASFLEDVRIAGERAGIRITV